MEREAKAPDMLLEPVWTRAAQPPEYPRIESDQSVDVCVIGAGIAGLSIAYMLSRDGAKVVVLDDGPVSDDRPGGLQVADATVGGRDGQADPGSELGGAQPAMHLKLGKNLSIKGVHRGNFCTELLPPGKRRKNFSSLFP